MKKQIVIGVCLISCLAIPAKAQLTDVEHYAAIEKKHAEAENLITVNDFPGAIKIYQEIILLEPDDETAYANMGHIHLILGYTGEAEDNFLNALDINPENETARLGLQKIHDPDAQIGAEGEI